MQTNEKLIVILNDLVEINNDRIKGYQKASDETKEEDMDLKAIFAEMGNKSKSFAAELSHKVITLGGESAKGTTNRGKIYRVWMDVKKAFTSNDRLTILESCEFGEDAIQKAYIEALAADVYMDTEIRKLITGQKSALKADHDLIRIHRDANVNTSS